MPLALTDDQLQRVMVAAQTLAVEKRATGSCNGSRRRLARMSGRPSDRDIARAAAAALRGLIHEPAV
jgi:hypothetical protein